MACDTANKHALTCTWETCSCSQTAVQWNQWRWSAHTYSNGREHYSDSLLPHIHIMSTPVNTAKLGTAHNNILTAQRLDICCYFPLIYCKGCKQKKQGVVICDNRKICVPLPTLLTWVVTRYALYWFLRQVFVLFGCLSFHQPPCLCLSCLSSSLSSSSNLAWFMRECLLDSCAGYRCIFLHSSSGPMTMAVGPCCIELRSCPLLLLFSSIPLNILSCWKGHILNPNYN